MASFPFAALRICPQGYITSTNSTGHYYLHYIEGRALNLLFVAFSGCGKGISWLHFFYMRLSGTWKFSNISSEDFLWPGGFELLQLGKIFRIALMSLHHGVLLDCRYPHRTSIVRCLLASCVRHYIMFSSLFDLMFAVPFDFCFFFVRCVYLAFLRLELHILPLFWSYPSYKRQLLLSAFS